MVSLYNNRLNGILADEMGLGKTVQVSQAAVPPALLLSCWSNQLFACGVVMEVRGQSLDGHGGCLFIEATVVMAG